MPIRFSREGPEFPDELVDDLLAGDVVFVCGAGVSAPQLPNFKDLVDSVFDRLHMEREPGEQRAYDDLRFEEVLGSLSRRLVHPSKMYQAVEEILSPPAALDLVHHEILLRLSRDLDGRVSLVTTNFDALFERAIERHDGAAVAATASVAGQSLPPPGSEDFAGVIHLHGRLSDAGLGLHRTPLVLTSAEYGDAYMRSGWASRFLFDLARCKTLVLIGYSATDAPVRYFLNILEADRARFSDLKSVYAFDAVESEVAEADARWSTIAVHPLTYRTTAEGLPPFGALWRDLAALAELVERPLKTQRDRVRAIVSTPFAQAEPDRIAELDWLLRSQADLWDIVLGAVEDPEWFDHITKRELWPRETRDRMLPFWCSQRWESLTRLRAAARWANGLSSDFGSQIETQLRFRGPSPGLWRRAWHLFAKADAYRVRIRGESGYMLAQRLGQGALLELDLQEAVDALTPHLLIEPPLSFSFTKEEEEAAPEVEPTSLRALFRASLTIRGEDGVGEVKQALLSLPEHVVRLCELLCAALNTSIRIANDADLISPLWDSVSRDVPSVEKHAQNQFHDGVLHLVGSLVGLLPALIANDAGIARRMADEWRGLPSQIGTRLWLHAQRTNALFSIDEIVANVLGLGKEDFWARQRELIVLLVDRLPEAAPAQIDQLVERIGREGPGLYLGEEYVRAGETDWRPSARDHDMWLRLLAIKRAGVLTEAGELLLAQIMARTSYLDADYDESDLFSTYSSGVRSVVGDAAPLLEAAPEERLEIAHKLQEGHQFGRQDDWRAYCGADPKGAFDSLSATGFRPEDVELWRSLIQSLAYPVPTEPPAQAARDRLLKKVFAALQPASDEQLTPLLHPLTDCLQSRFKMPIGLRARWWDRLWALAAAAQAGEDEQDAEADGERFLDHVINAPAGKIAEDLLRLIEAEKNARGAASRPTMARARRMLADTSRAGHLARGIFARHAGYLAHIDEPFTVRHLVPWLRGNSTRAVTLRAVLGQWSQLSARASKLLKAELIAAAIECRTSGFHAQHVVAKVLFPVVANKLNDEGVDWGFEPDDARRVLKLGTEDLRSAAAACLSIWQAKIVDIEPEEAWVRGIRPTFEEAWPQESKYRNTEIAGQLALLAVRTGKHFPEALEVVRPYLVATGERWPRLHFLDDSGVPSTFPGETLDLLWLLLRRRRESVGSPGLANALDAIKAAAPELEIDRRFQWLETKALRFS